MKKPCTLLVLLTGLTLTAHAAESSLEDVRNELSLTKARLELAEARLTLAAKESELARLGQPAAPGRQDQLWEQFSPGTPAKSQVRAALGNTGRKEWNELNPALKDFVGVRTGEGPAPGNQALVELGLVRKKAQGTATAIDVAATRETEAGTPEAPTATPAGTPADPTGDSVKKIFADIEDDVFFRNAGISFSMGYGVAFRHDDDRAVGTILARWNVRQAEATHWYNNLTAHGSDEGYQPVPYYGKNRAQLVEWYAAARGRPLSDRQGWLTAWGPFIGGTVAGEKIDSGSGEERPYLAGLSFGFGFSTQAASLFYVDLGTTISPKRGLKSNRLYVGFSADMALLPAVWNRIRGGK